METKLHQLKLILDQEGRQRKDLEEQRWLEAQNDLLHYPPKASSNSFPCKLHALLSYANEYQYGHIASWGNVEHDADSSNDDEEEDLGSLFSPSCFKIHDRDLFVHKVMPIFFPNCGARCGGTSSTSNAVPTVEILKYRSFTRQLNYYQFQRIRNGILCSRRRRRR